MKLLKLLCIAILGLCIKNTECIQLRSLSQAKEAINTAMGLSKAAPMLIITVRRRGKMRLISDDALEKLTQVLNDACLDNQSKFGFKNFYEKNQISQEHSKIFIFNEMFFSRTEPLTLNNKVAVLKKINDLSSLYPKSVFFVNFLFRELRNTTREKLHEDLLKMQEMKSTNVRKFPDFMFNKMHVEESAFRNCQAIIQSLPKEDTAIQHEYLVNQTYCINSGSPIAEYKKATYCSEYDSDIAKGVLYEFGDGITHKLQDTPVSDSVLKNTTIEICYDLFCGIRRSDDWKFDKHTYNPNNIHIIQSNTINPYDDGTLTPNRPFDQNRQNLPLDTAIVHADPNVYCCPMSNQAYESLFYIKNDEKKLTVNNIQCTKESFTVIIDKEEYVITFYVI